LAPVVPGVVSFLGSDYSLDCRENEMILLFIIIEIALLCVLVLLIRIAIRRGIARVLAGDEDFGDEFQPAGADTRTSHSVEATIQAVAEHQEKRSKAS
jgi:hypothetical protein